MSCSRWLRVVQRIGSTLLMRNGSMMVVIGISQSYSRGVSPRVAEFPASGKFATALPSSVMLGSRFALPVVGGGVIRECGFILRILAKILVFAQIEPLQDLLQRNAGMEQWRDLIAQVSEVVTEALQLLFACQFEMPWHHGFNRRLEHGIKNRDPVLHIALVHCGGAVSEKEVPGGNCALLGKIDHGISHRVSRSRKINFDLISTQIESDPAGERNFLRGRGIRRNAACFLAER